MLTGPSIIPENPTSAVVILHGFGADGQDLISLASLLKDDFPHTAFFAPNGPDQTPFGYGYQWFSDNDFTFLDREGIEVAKELVEIFLDEVVTGKYGIPRSNIVLTGFSQGTMTTLFTMSRLRESVAGIIGFSGLLMWDNELEQNDIKNHPPVLLVHGEDDQVVPPTHSISAKEKLEKLGYNVELHLLSGLAHGIDQRALNHMKDFLNKTLP